VLSDRSHDCFLLFFYNSLPIHNPVIDNFLILESENTVEPSLSIRDWDQSVDEYENRQITE